MSDANEAGPVVAAKDDCPLTQYQRVVLQWVANGKRDWQIASIMGNTTDDAISTHVRKIMDRLGAGSRSGAVAIAVRKGWVK